MIFRSARTSYCTLWLWRVQYPLYRQYWGTVCEVYCWFSTTCRCHGSLGRRRLPSPHHVQSNIKAVLLRWYLFCQSLWWTQLFQMTSTQQPTQSPTLIKSTRICIKNVPLLFSENQLREHIQNCGKTSMMITDCKILKTKTGQNRRIAFVGFKTQEVC